MFYVIQFEYIKRKKTFQNKTSKKASPLSLSCPFIQPLKLLYFLRAYRFLQKYLLYHTLKLPRGRTVTSTQHKNELMNNIPQSQRKINPFAQMPNLAHSHFLCLILSLYNSRYEHHRDLRIGLNESGHLYHLRNQLYLYLNYVNKLN